MPRGAQDEGPLLPSRLPLDAMDQRQHHYKISDSQALMARLYMALAPGSSVVDTGSPEPKLFPCLL